jgi:hypothetical protein
MLIEEHVLERFVQCPLMTPTSPSQVETCAYALASWTLRKSFENKFQGKPENILHEIRGKVLELWKGNQLEVGTLSRTAAFRLFNLVLDYEVIHLEQPYNLVLTGYTIKGKYALLRKRKGACLPHILILHTNEPELKHQQILPPDVITLSRYVHLFTTTTIHTDAQVVHYPIFRGKLWINKNINVPLAKRYLSDMLKVVIANPHFAVMGDHCSSCLTKPCMEMYKWTK